ncbi:hypothetical protein ABFS83_06G013400 [Erythranthe nasuta]
MFLRLSTKLLNISIASLCRAKQLEKAEAAIVDGIKLGVLPNVVTYNTLITGYCQFIGFDAGYDVIRRMKEAEITPDVITYNSLMAGATRQQNSLHRCREMLDEMLQIGITPDIWTYNTLMHSYFKSGNPGEAYKIFQDEIILKKNISPCHATFNILINGLCKNGCIGNALMFFRDLKQQGYDLDIVTYNILISSLCKARMWKSMMSLLEELSVSDHEPNAITYTAVMKACFRRKHFREGLEIFLEMKSKGYAYDLFSYCTVVGALLKSGRSQDTYSLIAHMIKIGYELDIVSYNTLINWHCKEHKIENAYNLSIVAKERGLKWDAYTHTILINGLYKSGDFDGAQRHIDHLDTTTFDSLVTSNCFIDSLCKFGHLEYALQVFHSMVVKDSFTYSSMVHNLCRARKYRLASQILLSCIKAGFKTLKSDRRAVVKGLSLTGSKKDVMRHKLRIQTAKLLFLRKK